LTSSTNYGTPWYPTSIPSCSLWLDADDASTVVLNGTDVLQWQDKSGKGNHFGQTTGSLQPLYATASNDFAPRSGIRLDHPAQTYLTGNTTDLSTFENSAEHITIFVAFNQYDHGTGANVWQNIYGFGRLDPNNTTSDSHGIYNRTDTGQLYYYANDGQSTHTAGNFIGPTFGNAIFTTNWSTDGSKLRITGSQIFANSNDVVGFAGTGLHVIGYGYGTRNSAIEYAEFIVYNRSLTDAEITTVETYLDNKWNIQ